MAVKDIATTLKNYGVNSNPQIAITGAHKAGKTSLAKKIADALKIRYVPEFARDLLEVTNFDWKKGDWYYIDLFEKAIFSCYKFTHKYLSDSGQGFVTDRTLVDITAYCLWHIMKGEILQSKEFFDFYVGLILSLAKSTGWYDVILYYRPIGLEIDSCQQFIDATIGELLNRYFNITSVFVIKRGDELRFGENLTITV